MYSVKIVYDTSNLIVQNQIVELIENKRYINFIRFVTTVNFETNSNQCVKLKESFINSRPISIKSLDSCSSFLHETITSRTFSVPCWVNPSSPQSTILKIAHHGYKAATKKQQASWEFYNKYFHIFRTNCWHSLPNPVVLYL